MEYTEQQREAIRADFARRWRNQLIATIPFGVFILAFAFFEDKATGAFLGLPQQVVGPVFLVLVAAVLAFSFWNWRCPACRSYLGRAFNPKHCSSCGVSLRA